MAGALISSFTINNINKNNKPQYEIDKHNNSFRLIRNYTKVYLDNKIINQINDKETIEIKDKNLINFLYKGKTESNIY